MMKSKMIKMYICVINCLLITACSRNEHQQTPPEQNLEPVTAQVEISEEPNEVDSMLYINNNPLIRNIPDPYVLKASDGEFYAYGTTDPQLGYRVYVSSDMFNWENKGFVYKNSKQWQSGDFWAPEVYECNDKFYLFYTAREKSTGSLKLGVAVSDSPTGEFIDMLDKPAFDYRFAMIDAHVFFDEDGRKYLYYSRDCSENIVGTYNTSQLYAVELEDDLMTAIGEPVLVSTPDSDLEISTGQYRWNEGAFVIKKNDTYYLMYSSGYYAEPSYHVSYSTSKNPLGPFVKSEKNPLLKSNVEENFSGPGHNSVFYHRDKMYIAYHTHMYSNGGGNRQMCINELSIDEDGNLEVLAPVTDAVQ